MGIATDDAIFNFVYELAMRDATIRTAFSGNREWLRNNGRAKQAVKDYVDNIINGDVADFEKTARAVWEAFTDENNNHVFKFGNCQKLINMTCKYMFITAYQNNDRRENFKHCHCPMDRKMVAIVVESANDYGINVDDVKKIKNCSWSRLEFQNAEIPQEYIIFQNAIRVLAEKENKTPIEFDYSKW